MKKVVAAVVFAVVLGVLSEQRFICICLCAVVSIVVVFVVGGLDQVVETLHHKLCLCSGKDCNDGDKLNLDARDKRVVVQKLAISKVVEWYESGEIADQSFGVGQDGVVYILFLLLVDDGDGLVGVVCENGSDKDIELTGLYGEIYEGGSQKDIVVCDTAYREYVLDVSKVVLLTGKARKDGQGVRLEKESVFKLIHVACGVGPALYFFDKLV